MPVTADRSEDGLAAATRAEIDRVRASGILGRSGRLIELFDYLVARSGEAASPKEIEIALEVFGKTGADAGKDDPVARVYVHRLRKRLDDHYLRHGTPGGVRLEVPKGEYRILGRRIDEPDGGAAPAAPAALRRLALALPVAPWKLAAALGALVVANAALWIALAAAPRGGELEQLRRDPFWADLVDDDHPLMIVVGDYYMFGELERGLFLNRLVRDFAINSREDLLASRRDASEEDEATYADVDARYLPVSTAYALARIAAVLPDDREVRVSLASELRPEVMRDYDLIYVGLVSGLGPLREPTFAGSRFSVGESYDVLVDTETGDIHASEAFLTPAHAMYRDYGLVARFDGPRGAEVLILAGARDAGATGVAESVTRLGSLRALHELSGAHGSLEGLYETLGQQQVSLESDILTAAPREAARAWSTLEAPLEFPSE